MDVLGVGGGGESVGWFEKVGELVEDFGVTTIPFSCMQIMMVGRGGR